MNGGILGSGDAAKALASGFLTQGHDVMLGTRTSAKLKDWATQHPKARLGSFAETVTLTRPSAGAPGIGPALQL